MKYYFPQWQGAGIGKNIETGAQAVLDFIADTQYEAITLSSLPVNMEDTQIHQINNYHAITEQLGRFKSQIEHQKPSSLQTIGGDCGLEIVPVSYLNLMYPNLGVIWFDAHADINKACDSASCNFHGMPLRTLLGEGNHHMEHLLSSTIVDSQIHYVGLRDIDAAEQKRIIKGDIYAPKKVNDQELVAVLKSKNITDIYIHFDCDCLDPMAYDKTFYHVPNGLKVNESVATIKTLQKNFNVVGSSVLESVTNVPSEIEPIAPILKLLLF